MKQTNYAALLIKSYVILGARPPPDLVSTRDRSPLQTRSARLEEVPQT
jgi:hypothetical protein